MKKNSRILVWTAALISSNVRRGMSFAGLASKWACNSSRELLVVVVVVVVGRFGGIVDE